MREMLEKNYNYQQDKFEFIKNPVVVEFLGLTPDEVLNETDLETNTISIYRNFDGIGKRIVNTFSKTA